MGNDLDSQETTAVSFLAHRDAPDVFGKLDYQLKDGVHIQNRENQYDFFRFIEANEESLKMYYLKYFGLILEFGGSGMEKFYFLDFSGSNRGSVDASHRHFFKGEFIIIGFLIYKIMFIDGNLDLTSVQKLKTTIKRDYEDLRPGIYKLIAKVKKESFTQMNDERVDEVVDDALKEFNSIAWILLDGDFFDVLPSFHRLNKIYSDYINNLDEWILKQSAK